MVIRAERLSSVALRWPPFAVIALGANLLVTLPLAWLLNIWQDEAYTLQTTSNGVAYAFHQALSFEQNAPLYFVLISLWRSLGDGIFYLRLFSRDQAQQTDLPPHASHAHVSRDLP